MRLRLVQNGSTLSIYAVVLDNGACPAEDYLERVRQRDRASHKSLVNLLTRHAEHGPMRNEKKSRAIKGKENLWEFKTRQGDRIPFFYLAGGKTVLTHGFHKGAPARTEYRKAEAIRDRYLQGG
jgi:hypothetical protein